MTRPIRHYAAARGSYPGELAAAAHDFAESFRRARLWTALAWNDTASRYRGSVLGPFWITITTVTFVVGIGVVYAELMNVEASRYVPWMATGVVIWNLMVQAVTDGSNAYLDGSQSIIQQTSIPLPVFIWRVMLRALINFAHQVPVIFLVAIYFNYIFKINLPLALLGLVLLMVNLSWMAFIAAIVSARFRDMQQVISSVLQLTFFLSPVIWIPSDMSRATEFLKLNPAYHMLDVTRGPLLGVAPHMESIIYLLVMAAGGWIVTFALFASVRRRIVHYL